MTPFSISPRRVILFFLDVLLGCLSIYFAFLLRFDWNIPPKGMDYFQTLIPFVIVIRSFTFIAFGFYTRFWEYSSLEDLFQIVKAVVTGSFLILFATFLYNRAISIPRPIIVIDMVLLVMMLGATRLFWRVWREGRFQKAESDKRGSTPVLIYGAGGMGAQLLKHLRQKSHYSVLGFLDDDPKKLNRMLMGVKVLGTRKDIPKVAHPLGIREILLSAPLSGESLAEIVSLCKENDVKHKTVSSIVDIATEEIHISKIRNIDVSDLLGREPVSLDLSMISNMARDKTILVTGAGGSIGSELCQQVLQFNPKTLLMIDSGENYLYELSMKLSGQAKDTSLHYIFGSVTDAEKMDAIFAEHRPQLVFHAAAHKHVPLMETHVDQAILNNLRGTQITADLSERYGVEKFVLVSTDKVVRPTSVMGMTKKAAEKYIQHISRTSKTHYVTVRFGNVLGSNGSVIPLFKSQIESGGPVTITDPNMTRYFMLIPEAAQLILQAAALGQGKEIFLLEMGEPVKILDLARKMILLAGYQPDLDIEIKVVGVRPGEKLYEELIDDGEQATPTPHRKIQSLKSDNWIGDDFSARYDALCQNARANSPETLKKQLQNLVQNEKQRPGKAASTPS